MGQEPFKREEADLEDKSSLCSVRARFSPYDLTVCIFKSLMPFLIKHFIDNIKLFLIYRIYE